MCTFEDLSARLGRDGHILIAVEIDDGRGGVTLCVAPGPAEPGRSFAAAALRGAWVVAPDSGGAN
jgi:hypothetical protein